jgi:RNA polymerase sigma-70 factor (ECF subfamily)
MSLTLLIANPHLGASQLHTKSSVLSRWGRKTLTDSELGTTVRLVQEARGGNDQAMEDLFRRYYPRVRQIVAFRVGMSPTKAEEVDDIIQDALFTVFEKLDQLEQDTVGSFYNWVARCVESRVNDYFRSAAAKKRGGGKVRRFAELGDSVLSESIFRGKDPTPSAVVRAKELDAKISDVLQGMSETERELIILRQLCDMSYDEIAEDLKLPSGEAARKACRRALMKLQDEISE